MIEKPLSVDKQINNLKHLTKHELKRLIDAATMLYANSDVPVQIPTAQALTAFNAANQQLQRDREQVEKTRYDIFYAGQNDIHKKWLQMHMSARHLFDDIGGMHVIGGQLSIELSNHPDKLPESLIPAFREYAIGIGKLLNEADVNDKEFIGVLSTFTAVEPTDRYIDLSYFYELRDAILAFTSGRDNGQQLREVYRARPAVQKIMDLRRAALKRKPRPKQPTRYELANSMQMYLNDNPQSTTTQAAAFALWDVTGDYTGYSIGTVRTYHNNLSKTGEIEPCYYGRGVGGFDPSKAGL